LTVQSEGDCLDDLGVTTFRELACHLRHQFRSDSHRCPIIGIDGFSGSGKSDFAHALALELGATVINTDDFVPGWEGLRASIDLLEEWILVPISQDQTASWQRFDWHLMRPAEWHDVVPSSVLIVEGCGVGHKKLSSFLSYLVWMNAPVTERLRRIHSRFDWEMYEPYVDMWAEQERQLRAGDDAEARADLVVESGVVRDDVDPKSAFVRHVPKDWYQ
jgi:para-aminobenzoate synthetase